MYRRLLFIFLNVFVLLTLGYTQDSYERNKSADVTNYIFSLTLNDVNNEIIGESEVTVLFKNGVERFALDLVGKSGVFGMKVTEVLENNERIDFEHLNNKLIITPGTTGSQSRTYTIKYNGIPERG
mgnify:FL=1